MTIQPIPEEVGRYFLDDEDVTVFKSANEFSQYIEQKALDGGVTVLQALVEYVEDNEVDVDKIKPMISKSLSDKLYQCYVDLGMIKNKNQNLNDVLF